MAAQISVPQTPRTPLGSVHSANSTPSTLSRAHQLTLHEYRKQQSSPLLSYTSPGKQSRRKAALPDLGSVEQDPARSPNPPVVTPARPFLPSRSPNRYSHANNFLPPPPPPSPPTAHPHVEPLSQPRHFTASAASPSLGASLLSDTRSLPGLLRSAPTSQLHSSPGPYTDGVYNLLQDLGRILRPTKRLSRPQSKYNQTVGHDSLKSSSTGVSSTISASRFPYPPNYHALEPAANKGQENQLPNAIDQDQPTVLHYRGASFDVVNPHQSLLLSNIETPGERESWFADYFQGLRRDSNLKSTVDAAMGGSSRSSEGLPGGREKQRLFDDLTSAHRSITGRRSQSSNDVRDQTQVMTDLPLPPIPAASNPYSIDYGRVSSDEETFHPMPRPLHVLKSARPASFMERLSRALPFHRRKTSSAPSLLPTLDEPGVEMHPMTGRASTSYRGPFTDHEYDVEAARAQPAEDVSQVDDSHYYYDHNSIYPSTVGRDDSVSLYPSSILDNHSVPQGTTMTDVGSEDTTGTDPFRYDVQGSARNSDFATRLNSQYADMAAKLKSTPTKHTQSTIGSIINRYGREYTEPSPSEDLVRRVGQAYFNLDIRGDDNKENLQPTTSGLGQFTFGIGRVSSHGSFPERAERGSPRNGSRLSWQSPGGPPNIPLPRTPDYELEPPRMPFAGRNISNLTEGITSNGSSYGDTRHLLLLSQQFSENNSGHPTTSGPFGLSPGGSSPALPGSMAADQAERPSSGLLTPPVESRPRAPRHATPEILRQEVQNEVKRISQLSQMSGISNLSGNVFILSPGTPKEGSRQSKSRVSESVSPESNVSPGEELATESASHRRKRHMTNRSAGIPKLWSRRGGSPILNRPSYDGDTSISGEDFGDEDDGDWETVADSRPYLRSDNTKDSFASYLHARVPMLPQVKVHPGDPRYQHTYRIHSPDNVGLAILPKYEFPGQAGFPNTNALTPPSPSSAEFEKGFRQHEATSGDDDQAFQSSPPRIPSNATREWGLGRPEDIKNESLKQNVAVIDFADALPVSNEVTTASKQGTTTSTHFNARSASTASWQTTANSKASSSPPRKLTRKSGKAKPETRFPIDGRESPKVLHVAKGGPLSPKSLVGRDNSFAKYTVLGPKANLTGTPNGTGMREVGSSVADVSSPAAWFSSSSNSPLTDFSSTTKTSSPMSPSTLSNFSSPSGPAVTYSSATKRSGKFIVELKQHRDQLKDVGLLRASNESGKRASLESGRPYVENMTELKELRLPRETKPGPRTACGSGGSMKEQRSATTSSRGSGRSDHPRAVDLLTAAGSVDGVSYSDILPSVIDEPEDADAGRARKQHNHPNNQGRTPLIRASHHLITRPRASARLQRPSRLAPPSWRALDARARANQNLRFHHAAHLSRPRLFKTSTSSIDIETSKRKSRLSWIFLVLCCLFPPLLLLYGYGWLDVLMAMTTGDDVKHMGRVQKRVARWVGWPLGIGLPVGIAVGMVVVAVRE